MVIRRSMAGHPGNFGNVTLEEEDDGTAIEVSFETDFDAELNSPSPSKTPLASSSFCSTSSDLSPVSRFRKDLHEDASSGGSTDDDDSLRISEITGAERDWNNMQESEANSILAREESRNVEYTRETGEKTHSQPRFHGLQFDRQQPDENRVEEKSLLHVLELPSLVDTPGPEDRFKPQLGVTEDEERLSRTPRLSTRRARFASDNPPDGLRLVKSLSMTESDVGSLDGLPSNVQSLWRTDQQSTMSRLDGVANIQTAHIDCERLTSPLPEENPTAVKQNQFLWPLSFLFGNEEDSPSDQTKSSRRIWRPSVDDSLGILNCNPNCNPISRRGVRVPAVPSSLVKVKYAAGGPSFAEAHLAKSADPRMQDWVEGKLQPTEQPLDDGAFSLGKSRTVIVHEIARGDWTWCTAWSPAGDKLAVATENHNLAIIETTASTVWRVQHDTRIVGPAKTGTTHSIRSIAWGSRFIAIGGTGNAVSIMYPDDPDRPVHKIMGTGFVGSLSWRKASDILAIGSRLDKAMIVRILELPGTTGRGVPRVESEILQTVDCENWVNSALFSPGGTCLSVGDAGGRIAVYKYNDRAPNQSKIDLLKKFKLEDSVLDMEWSPDGKWLYAGGEDMKISVIDTSCWEVVHKIERERWVQCISSSNTGSHISVGGVSSEISILETHKGWESVMGVELKGLVPLSAQWHPRDQFLAITGQSDSVIAIETTDARHVQGHHLHSAFPVLAVEFSPDGRMALVGSENGAVTMFSLSGSTFETEYELVMPLNKKISFRWSLNGTFVIVGTEDSQIILKRRPEVKGATFGVRKVIRDMGETHVIAVDSQSQYVVLGGEKTRILDASADFQLVREWDEGPIYATAWSPDGRWLAAMGSERTLTIYDTGSENPDAWRPIFSLHCEFVGRTLVWGPKIVGGLLYLAYGGDGNEIYVMEVRTFEGTWETVLRIPRDGTIRNLDWSSEGLLAAGTSHGTVSIVDLGYLQSGIAVNEMNYNWQRQALTCFTEIRRNRGRNSITAVKWIPSAPGSDCLLAVGGTDGQLEILDLTERRRCGGFE